MCGIEQVAVQGDLPGLLIQLYFPVEGERNFLNRNEEHVGIVGETDAVKPFGRNCL